MVGAMSNLQQLLGLLARPDVGEVLLQTDAPPYARMGQELKPLSRQTLTLQHIAAFVQGTPVTTMLADAKRSGMAAGDFTVGGTTYTAQVMSAPNQTRVRLARAQSVAPAVASRPASQPMPEPAAGSATGSTFGSTFGSGGDTDNLAQLLAHARQLGASDVHVQSGQPVRIRSVGALQPVGAAIPHDRVVAMLEPLFGPGHRHSFDELGYADLAAEVDGLRLRININRQRGGWKGCFRLIASGPSSLAELGLPAELGKITVHHQGLVVVSGPSGTGKTTTMAALVHLFNQTRPVHIITVEDPVEIIHPIGRALITQREVGAHTQSFYRALKGALREDPDIIVIGELRDRETVEMALSAAETGHLVLATMSTPSGARTIDRLIDMFPPDVQSQVRATLAGALKMVIGLRLIATADGTGQVAAAELITGNVPLWALIRDNKLFQLPSLLQRGRAYGMIRIEDSLNDLVSAGTIDADTARRYADDPKAINGGRGRRKDS